MLYVKSKESAKINDGNVDAKCTHYSNQLLQVAGYQKNNILYYGTTKAAI